MKLNRALAPEVCSPPLLETATEIAMAPPEMPPSRLLSRRSDHPTQSLLPSTCIVHKSRYTQTTAKAKPRHRPAPPRRAFSTAPRATRPPATATDQKERLISPA